MATTGLRRWPPISKLDLLGDPQRIVDLHPKIANCTLQFRVSEKDLDSAQVARLLVDQCSLGVTDVPLPRCPRRIDL